MENKNIILIGILIILIIFLSSMIIFTLNNNNTTYERIEITPNGTSIEIPTNNATYVGELNNTGTKLWKFQQGTIMTFNSNEAVNARGLYGLGGAMGVKETKDMILNHFEKRETIDGFTVYTLDADKLDIKGRDTIYCIETGNDTTHDNIIIATDNKDITLHIAKSIQYKTSNSTNNIKDSSDYTENSNSSNSPSVYAYKSDGTPMYSKTEADNYMLKKYGTDDYKRQSNGYIDPDSVGKSKPLK